MGNACCSDGGQSLQNEYKYDSSGQPVNQSAEGLGQNSYRKGKADEKNLLLAYTSGQQRKLVELENNYRGEDTKKRLDDGNKIILNQLEQYKSGQLSNVHNMKIFADDQSQGSAIYSGQMLQKNNQNVKQGYGIMRWPDGTVYEGLWQNDYYNGRGKLYHASGDLYEGEFVNDMAQGFGIYKHANGSKYVGYWNQDKQHGFGKEQWNDGSQYQGFYLNASKEGQGEYCWPDGNRYVGEWKDNMLNGKGLFIWHDDRLFLGDWKDNMMHGDGTYKWGDGRVFHGKYVDDRKNGHGIYLWADGRAYNGDWKNGKQHGNGFYIVVDPNDPAGLKIKKGVWVEGKRKEWRDDISEQEIEMQKRQYQEILDRKKTILDDIQKIEETMKTLVVQQLGDRANFDSSLHDLTDYVPDSHIDTPKMKDVEQPLEKLIKEALNYDSTVYRQALGVEGSDQMNGVLKSQEFEKERIRASMQ